MPYHARYGQIADFLSDPYLIFGSRWSWNLPMVPGDGLCRNLSSANDRGPKISTRANQGQTRREHVSEDFDTGFRLSEAEIFDFPRH